MRRAPLHPLGAGPMRRPSSTLDGPDLCGGFRPTPLWERESQLGPLPVRRPERHAADRADRHDQLLPAVVLRMDRERDEPVARLRGQRLEREPVAVGELDLDVRLVGVVTGREALDLTVETGDEVVQ